jgi:hypothetical protein
VFLKQDSTARQARRYILHTSVGISEYQIRKVVAMLDVAGWGRGLI